MSGCFFYQILWHSQNILTLGTKDKRTFAEKKTNKKAGQRICKLIMSISRLHWIYIIVKDSSADLWVLFRIGQANVISVKVRMHLNRLQYHWISSIAYNGSNKSLQLIQFFWIKKYSLHRAMTRHSRFSIKRDGKKSRRHKVQLQNFILSSLPFLWLRL